MSTPDFTQEPTPVALPVSTEEFAAWSEDIVKRFGLPDTDDTREILATSIMHLNQNVAYKPLEYFRDIVNKGRANRVAYEVLQVFDQKRRKQVETTQEVSNEQKS